MKINDLVLCKSGGSVAAEDSEAWLALRAGCWRSLPWPQSSKQSLSRDSQSLGSL